MSQVKLYNQQQRGILGRVRIKSALLSAVVMSLVVASGCRPGGDVDPSDYLIYTLDPETGEYRLSKEKIRTLRNIRQVDGDVLEMQGGGELAEGIEGDPVTREDWEQALIIKDSAPPSIEYTVDDGTLIPWDFDSAMMLTVYHHMERSYDYFNGLELGTDLEQDLGAKVGDMVGKIPCYYYPQIKLGGIPLPLFTDNAAYAYTLNAFLVPPRASLDDAVPIYANRGVITHEYGHAVFNRLVYNNERVPDFLFEEWETDPAAIRALNEIGGLDEGLSDVWGALDTKDPNYIAASIDEDLIDRDMGKIRFYETCLFLAVDSGVYPSSSTCGGNYGEGVANPTDSEDVRFDYSEGDGYDSHHLGAVVGSIFWEIREQQRENITDDEWARYVVQAMRDIQNPTKDFRLSMFFNALHDQVPVAHQSEVCQTLHDRLLAIRDELQCLP